MTAPSAYPPAIDDLMPRAIELTKSLDGELPSRNRLMKDLKIGGPKASAVLAELGRLAEQDQAMADRYAYRLKQGRAAYPPPLALVPPPDDITTPDELVESEPTVPAAAVDPAGTPAVDSPGPDVPGVDEDQGVTVDDVAGRKPVTWPVFILCLPAFVAIWGGWVEMGRLTGFGKVTLLPGIFDSFQLNTAITLPVGVETYAAYGLFVWLSGRATGEARRFAKWSALGSLGLGGLGQIAYHLMNAAGWTSAPWPITAAVSCIPVAVLGMGAALAHLMHRQ
jgi:hypothetical protein